MRRSLLATLVFLSGCSSVNDLATAEREIGRFHAELNAGQFDKIFQDAAPEWKQASSAPDAVKLFAALHNKLGAFVSGKQNGWRENYGTGGTTIVVVYASKFQKGDAVETFTYRPSKTGAQIVGYNVNSPALITG